MSQLVRVGVSFTDTEIELAKSMQKANDLAGAQALVLKGLQGQFKGLAEKVADTASGELKQLNNAIGDQKELLGQELIPLIIEWKNSVLDITQSIIPLVKGIIDFNKRTDGSLATLVKGTVAALGFAAAVSAISAAIRIGIPLLVSWNGLIGAATLGSAIILADLVKRWERLNRTIKETKPATKDSTEALSKALEAAREIGDEFDDLQKKSSLPKGITGISELASKIQSALLGDAPDAGGGAGLPGKAPSFPQTSGKRRQGGRMGPRIPVLSPGAVTPGGFRGVNVDGLLSGANARERVRAGDASGTPRWITNIKTPLDIVAGEIVETNRMIRDAFQKKASKEFVKLAPN